MGVLESRWKRIENLHDKCSSINADSSRLMKLRNDFYEIQSLKLSIEKRNSSKHLKFTISGNVDVPITLPINNTQLINQILTEAIVDLDKQILDLETEITKKLK